MRRWTRSLNDRSQDRNRADHRTEHEHVATVFVGSENTRLASELLRLGTGIIPSCYNGSSVFGLMRFQWFQV